ncbi:MAG: hypothetical protein FJZ10_04325 [Candidatus Omnitrophica bacterium]|nr:hypothetical protein [Candidatus Omnitrophota bacterium]
MRKYYIFLSAFFSLIVFLLIHSNCLAQIKEEKQKRLAGFQILHKKPPSYNLNSSVAFFSGYDNNVKLSPEREGSIFEEVLYSLNFNKPLSSKLRLLFNYDIDYLNYNSVPRASNLLNHLRVGVDKRLSRILELGVGCDLSDFYYPKDSDGDFIFSKGFIYLKNRIGGSSFQQLALEYGYKIHAARKALSNSISELGDNPLTDKRRSIEYTIGSNISPALFIQCSGKFSQNNSNARYIDFYDYRGYELSPSVHYKLSEKINLVGDFSYLRKLYSDRTINTGDKKEKDNVFYANTGLRYKLNRNDTLSFFYTYRGNSTNEDLEQYTESVFTVGLEHGF